MNYRWKKPAAILCTLAISASMLAGCGNSKDVVVKDAEKVLFTYDGEEVTLKEAYIYAKMNAASTEQMYSMYGLGTDFWTMEVENGKTIEDSVKESTVDQIKRIIVLDNKAEEAKITLSDSEVGDCKNYAKEFAKTEEGKAILKACGANADDMQEIYEDNALASKMQKEAVKDTDTKVSDDEARHTTITRVVFETTKTNEEDGSVEELSAKEKAEAKKKAEAALKKAKSGTKITKIAKDLGYTNTSETYGEGESEEGEAFEKAMAKVKDGEVLDKVMECNNGYVVAKMKAYTDKDATESAKEEIIAQRQQEKFTEVYTTWTKKLEKDWDYEKSVDQTLWAEVVLRSEDSTEAQEETTGAGEEDTAAEASTQAK